MYVINIAIIGGKRTVKKKTPTKGRVPKEKVKEGVIVYTTGSIYRQDQRPIPGTDKIIFKEQWGTNPGERVFFRK